MPRLAPKALCLAAEAREQLQQLIKRQHTPQQTALRASIMLLADAGKNHRVSARELAMSRQMAQLWRRRWLAGVASGTGVAERLQDAERSGAPATFEGAQVGHLLKLACDDPSEYNRPSSQWTARAGADAMIEQESVKTISRRQVGRGWAEADLKPQQSGDWLNPPRPRVRCQSE